MIGWRPATALAAIALAIAAAVFWWPWRPAGPSGSPTRTSADMASAGSTRVDAPEPSPRAGPARAPAALPPPSAPLAQSLPALRAAADAGDRHAACRLGRELLRCEQLAQWDTLLARGGDWEARAEAEGNLVGANQAAEEKLWRLERLQQCRGVPAGVLGEGARYLRQSALAGDPYAMVAYAEGHHWGPSVRGVAVGEDFDRWRREAPGMIHAALRAGNPSAAFILSINYSDDTGFLSALIPNDPHRAYTFHLLTVRLFGTREYPSRARALDAATVERARREADAMHARYFGGRRFPQSQMMQYPLYVPAPSGQSPSACETSP